MSSVFPIEDKPRYQKYTATAGQVLFAIPFNFQQTRDIQVQKTLAAGGDPVPLTQPKDLTVAGAGVDNGGSFTLSVGAVEGDVLEVWGEAVIDRTGSVVQSGQFKARAHDDEHDRHRIIQQELSEGLSRAIRGPRGQAAPEILGTIGAGKALVTDADGNLVEGPSAGEITAAQGYAATASTRAGEASSSAGTASGAASTATAARDKAQAWAEEVEDTEVETGKYSAKHWAAKAAQDASGVAANIAYDNQASGLTATDAQAAIDELASAPSNLLGDPEAANVEVMDQSDPSDPNEVFVTAGITTFREVGTLSPLLEVSSAGVVPYGPIYDRTGNELLAGFELAEQIIMSSQSVTIPANVNRVYMKVTGAGGGGSRFFGGAIQGSSAGTTTASVNGTTFQANGGTGAGSGPTTTYVYNGSHGGASGGTINTTGGGAAGGPPVSSGGRGGNGGYCEGEVTGITPGQSVSITIGAPGGGASTGGSASVSLVFRGGTL